MVKGIKEKIMQWFRLSHQPSIRVYNGYGNGKHAMVFGHVLAISPMRRQTYQSNWLVNTFYLIRLFMVRPYPHASVSMEWKGRKMISRAQDNGYFKFEWMDPQPIAPGWYDITVTLEEEKFGHPKIAARGQLHIPAESKSLFISDIDDTFLVSHSSRFRKRLYLLFTKNARTRRPFEGVIHHYQLLAAQGRQPGQPNPFFYVSSSEWNLFHFILEFSQDKGLPKGVYLLNELKSLRGFWRSGQDKHAAKFFRIVRILEMFPDRSFILFGDDSQEDPVIYNALTIHFRGRVIAVYIRRVHSNKFHQVRDIIGEMEARGIPCCYFLHSSQAIAHSREIGLLN